MELGTLNSHGLGTCVCVGSTYEYMCCMCVHAPVSVLCVYECVDICMCEYMCIACEYVSACVCEAQCELTSLPQEPTSSPISRGREQRCFGTRHSWVAPYQEYGQKTQITLRHSVNEIMIHKAADGWATALPSLN